MSQDSISNLAQGIILLNKHQDISSNLALQKVKRLFGIKKAGHAGNLDPLATGMLPICLGEATKVCHYLLNADKGYEATGLLGIKTNTSDSTGEAIAVFEDFSISNETLSAILQSFLGTTQQIPSMFSALKHQGKALYHYARAGIEVERKARDIEIKALELISFNGKQFQLRIQCSKGTYIRNLIEDIGDTLGVGAHMTQLHRTYTSGFEDKKMYTLNELAEMTFSQRMDCLIPMDQAIDHLDTIIISSDEVLALRQGRIVVKDMNLNPNNLFRIYDCNHQFIGLVQSLSAKEIKAKRLLAY